MLCVYVCVCVHASLPSIFFFNNFYLGFPGSLSGNESACYCRRHKFNPWVGKIPRRKKQQPTPVSLSGNYHGQRNPVGYSPWGDGELDTAERLSTRFYSLIYFWLCWIFFAAGRLSLAVACGGYSLLWCMGFPLRQLFFCRAQAAGSRALIVAAPSLAAAAHGL